MVAFVIFCKYSCEANVYFEVLIILYNCKFGTHEDERTVLFKTISLDGIKPNTNPETNSKTNPNPNPNTNPNPKLTLVLTLFSYFMLFFEYRPLIFSLAVNLICSHVSKVVSAFTSYDNLLTKFKRV